MAQADTYNSSHTPVYGSLAYDFTRVGDYFPEYDYVEPEVAAPPVVEEQTKTKTRTAPKTRQAVAPTAILGFACAAVLLVFALLAQIQLTAVSDNAAQLQGQLAELQLQQKRLLISYESALNLNEIEEMAMRELGMQKPRSDQVYYVDSSAPDKAVVLAVEQSNGLFDRFADFLSSISEFLK